jgi:hypothetical protein
MPPLAPGCPSGSPPRRRGGAPTVNAVADSSPHHSVPQTADFVVLLAAHPVAVAALLREHIPDGQLRCRACTTPGTGTPQAHWPCTLAGLARAAANLTAPPAASAAPTTP